MSGIVSRRKSAEILLSVVSLLAVNNAVDVLCLTLVFMLWTEVVMEL